MDRPGLVSAGIARILHKSYWLTQKYVGNSYQQGVEYFNQSTFTEAGYANDTMSRLTQILQNENGHLAIFEAAIPPGAVSSIYLRHGAQTWVANQKIIRQNLGNVNMIMASTTPA